MQDIKESYGLFEKMLSISVELFILNRVRLDTNEINKCSYMLLIKSSVSAFSSYFKRSTLKSPAMRHSVLVLDIAETTLTLDYILILFRPIVM